MIRLVIGRLLSSKLGDPNNHKQFGPKGEDHKQLFLMMEKRMDKP
jgi:hypothetical protein